MTDRAAVETPVQKHFGRYKTITFIFRHHIASIFCIFYSIEDPLASEVIILLHQ